MAYLQNTVSSQLPRHIVKDYPLFVEFLKAYYEWMGENGQPYYAVEKHLDWMNFKDSMDDYISYLREEYLFNLPASTAGGLELFLKNSKQFHLTVGTEQSFKFIFKILFGEAAGDVELYFPRNDILKVSDSTWTAAQSVLYITDSGHSADFLYRVLKQTREVYPGVFRYAYAIVQRVSDRYAGKFKITELYLRNIDGEFQTGWPVTVEGRSEWIIPTGNQIKITNPGSGYYLDDKILIGGQSSFVQKITATTFGKVDTQITGLFTNSELSVKIDGISVINFNYDGQFLTHTSILEESLVEVTFPTFSGYLAVKKIGVNSGIEEIQVYDSPIGILEPHPLGVVGSPGTGFNATVDPDLTRELAGYYIDDKGHLDSSKVIQDSNYYQDFSYVIRSSLDVDKYRDIVLKLLHPAGMKMFGKVDILEIVKLFILDISEIITIPERSVIMDLSEAGLYSTFRDIEKYRYIYEETVWKTFYVKDVKVGDVVGSRMKQHYNIQDTIVTIATP